MTTSDTVEPADVGWAIVEMLGHRRTAGYLREVQIAGAGFLRLDIPDAGSQPARTQYIAPGSIYAVHPVSEAIARSVAAYHDQPPAWPWELAGHGQRLQLVPSAETKWGPDSADEER